MIQMTIHTLVARLVAALDLWGGFGALPEAACAGQLAVCRNAWRLANTAAYCLPAIEQVVHATTSAESFCAGLHGYLIPQAISSYSTQTQLLHATKHHSARIASRAGHEGYKQKSLADVILAKIREKRSEAGVAPAAGEGDVPEGLDDKVVEVYRCAWVDVPF